MQVGGEEGKMHTSERHGLVRRGSGDGSGSDDICGERTTHEISWRLSDTRPGARDLASSRRETSDGRQVKKRQGWIEEEQSCFAVSDGEESRVKAGHVRVGSGVMSHELCHDLPAGGASTDRGMMWHIGGCSLARLTAR